MNIFKKIQTANKLFRIYSDIKTYIDNNKISIELKTALNALKFDIQRTVKIIPQIEKSVNELMDIIKK